MGQDGVIANSDDPGGTACVLIVDDHQVLVEALAVALQSQGFRVAYTNAEPPSEFGALLRRVQPDVVLLDLWLGTTVGSGLGLIPTITATGARVVVLTASEDAALLASCVEAGAYDLASKTEPFSTVLAKVQSASDRSGGLPEPERAALLAVLRVARSADAQRLAPFERLTTREEQVLVCLISGQSAQDIATSIPVSLSTVRTQIRGILTKLNMPNQLAAVALARRAGWPDNGHARNHQF